MQATPDDFPPYADDADRELLARAADALSKFDFAELSESQLVDIATRESLDLATAMLYLALRHSPQHRAFIRAIENVDTTPVHQSEPATLLIMPGAFHKHYRDTGADGARLFAAASALGWPKPEVVSVRSFDSVHANAEALIDHLLNMRSQRVVLASLSKGSADVAIALRHPRAAEAFSRVRGWLSISGLVHGTALVGWLRRHRLRTIGVHLMLWSRLTRFVYVDELTRASGALLDAPIVVPPHLNVIHLLGFPTPRHLANAWSQRGHARLASMGPNDGCGIILSDTWRMPGNIYPVWGADHYLMPSWDFAASLQRLLLHAATSQSAASTIPASKSTA